MTKRGRPKHPDLLTPREQEVLSLIREGLTNPQIAERLGIGLEGVKYHVSEILSKLQLSSREEAARWSDQGARPWWLGAVAFWRPPLRAASIAAAGGVLVAAVAGLVLLAVLLVRESGDDANDAVGSVALVTRTPVPLTNPPFRLDGPMDPTDGLPTDGARAYVLDVPSKQIFVVVYVPSGSLGEGLDRISWLDDDALVVEAKDIGRAGRFQAELSGEISSHSGDVTPTVTADSPEDWSLSPTTGSHAIVLQDGQPRYRLANLQSATWSPDKRLLALSGDYASGQCGAFHLIIFDPETATLTDLSEISGQEVRSFVWSPDGSSLTAHVATGAADQFVKFDIGSGTAETLLETRAERLVPLEWNPAGTHLLFQLGGGHGSCDPDVAPAQTTVEVLAAP